MPIALVGPSCRSRSRVFPSVRAATFLPGSFSEVFSVRGCAPWLGEGTLSDGAACPCNWPSWPVCSVLGRAAARNEHRTLACEQFGPSAVGSQASWAPIARTGARRRGRGSAVAQVREASSAPFQPFGSGWQVTSVGDLEELVGPAVGHALCWTCRAATLPAGRCCTAGSAGSPAHRCSGTTAVSSTTRV